MKTILFFFLVALAVGSTIILRAMEKTKIFPSHPDFQITYNCDGDKTINAAFYNGEVIPTNPGEPPMPTGKVKVILSDKRTLILNQTISASGVRYANSDESFIFWNKGDNVLVLENNFEKDFTNCTTKLQ